jgi:acyl-CoA thioester hydrolase
MTTSDERSLTSRDFPVHWPVLTRWTDNDMFGHLNNAVFYEFFDTAINGWINTSTGIDPLNAPWLDLVAESGCRYFSELRFPDPLVIGLTVARLGRTSVRYRLGVFQTALAEPPGDAVHPIAALGHWVHVYVDRTSRRPVPIPDAIRSLLETARAD